MKVKTCLGYCGGLERTEAGGQQASTVTFSGLFGTMSLSEAQVQFLV